MEGDKQHNKKEEYERRVQEQIQEWERRIENLKKRVREAQSSLKGEASRESKRYGDELESLKVKRDAAKRLLDELKKAGGRAWTGFQNDLGRALEGAGDGLHRLAERLRKQQR